MIFLTQKYIHPTKSILIHLYLILHCVSIAELPLFHINFISIIFAIIIILNTSLLCPLGLFILYQYILNDKIGIYVDLNFIYILDFLKCSLFLTILFYFISYLLLSCIFGGIIYLLHRKRLKYCLSVYLLIISQYSLYVPIIDMFFITGSLVCGGTFSMATLVCGYLAGFIMCISSFKRNIEPLIYSNNQIFTYLIAFIHGIISSHIKTVVFMIFFKYHCTQNSNK
ncbi:hypothetical protein SLOPH_974 [Spraguea lophii 42_110]|uniref:Uncharacterized protein n=1 Tax=Spraguea lophii (strain 42_110) TaxID=1358809 RepID=S7W7S2_SPRLO|nr:hypothetical protein SLOPH_974 [Spraguea lophii 42_110]